MAAAFSDGFPSLYPGEKEAVLEPVGVDVSADSAVGAGGTHAVCILRDCGGSGIVGIYFL